MTNAQIRDSPLRSLPPPDRLEIHRGRATLEMAGAIYSGFAEFLLPKHYTAKETIRLWRNGVMHGGEWPSNDSTALRRLFDKWRLFLFRRVLIRLGYVGKVDAPHKGWASSSDVSDFSEGYNSFEPADPKAPNPMAEFVKVVKQLNANRPAD